MNLYKKAKKELKLEKEQEKDLATKRQEFMNQEFERISTFLDSLKLSHKLTFDRHLKIIEIDLVKQNKSPYSKSHIRITPKVEYWCNHYSVNKWSCNEVLSQKYNPSTNKEIIELIKKDIKQASKFHK